MKKLIFLVFVVLGMSACSEKNSTIEKPVINDPVDTTKQFEIRYLALGDSYTIGHAVNMDERFPIQLADSLKNAGMDSLGVQIIARTGWTTGELLNAIENQNPGGSFDLVTLLIGVNNQYRGLDINEYREELRTLLNISISLAAGDTGKVIVVSIPDYGVTPFAQKMDSEKIAREIDTYNAIKKEEAIRYSVHFIDITPLSRLAKDDLRLIANDGLHPSGKMYAEWVKLIYPIAHLILDTNQNQSE